MVRSVIYDPTDRSLKERVFHALAFEILAILITAPMAALLMAQSVSQMGILTIMFAVIALLCNMIFNFLFDLAQRRMGFKRTIKVRIFHTVLFEFSFVAISVPLAAWWLSMGLLEAFILDFGLTVFFLVYTFVFNYVYDKLRERLFIKKMAKQGIQVKL